MHCYTQCPQPCSRPPLTHTSARYSWTLTGKSRSVSCGVTAPGSWCAQVLFVPSKSFSSVLCKFWQLYGGVNGNLLQVGNSKISIKILHSGEPESCGKPRVTSFSCLCTHSLFSESQHRGSSLENTWIIQEDSLIKFRTYAEWEGSGGTFSGDRSVGTCLFSPSPSTLLTRCWLMSFLSFSGT